MTVGLYGVQLGADIIRELDGKPLSERRAIQVAKSLRMNGFKAACVIRIGTVTV